MDKKEIETAINALLGEWARLDSQESIDKVRYSGPKFDENEYRAAVSAILSGWSSGGQFTLQTEQKISEISQRNHTLLCNSGSSANLLAISAIKEKYLKDGDKVLTLSCAFPTTINPIIQNNLIPVIVDIDDQLGLCPSLLEKCIKEKDIKCVFYAHTLGFPGQVDKILDICRKYNVIAAFDCCDAYGTYYKGKPLTSLGKVVTNSYYAAHHLSAMGHCGSVSTNDPELNQIMRSLRGWGRFCSSFSCCVRSLPNGRELFCPTQCLTKTDLLPEDYGVMYRFEYLGYNLQTNEIQAAVLGEQLKKMGQFDEIRRRNYNLLYEWFQNNWPECKTFPITDNISPFSFPLILKNCQRHHLVNHLKRDKIESRPIFSGKIQNHPAYDKNKHLFEEYGGFGNSEEILENGLMLGVSQILEETDINKIIDSLKEFK